MKHLLSIEAMEPKSIETILENSAVMKTQRGNNQHQRLAGQTEEVERVLGDEASFRGHAACLARVRHVIRLPR